MARGGELIVRVVTISSDNPSSNPACVYNYSCVKSFEKNENKQMRPDLVHFYNIYRGRLSVSNPTRETYPGLLFVCFESSQSNVFSLIWTRIVRPEGKFADHKTTLLVMFASVSNTSRNYFHSNLSKLCNFSRII